MDRELALSVFVLLLGGVAAQAAGFWPVAPEDVPGGRELERRAWRQIWHPLAPASLVCAALAGWAWSEPVDAEALPARLLVGALPFALVCLRAGVRAWRACFVPADVVAATVGLLHPRVVISPRLHATLDESARRAALLHEEAHARHRDPLRFWLAQIATDLQWPWPSARRRLLRWIESLEWGRDEEVREQGIAGEDLAAAVLAGARLSVNGSRASVGMVPATARLETRVRRLLEPLVPDAPQRARGALAALCVSAAAAVLVGAHFGERLVQALLGAS